MDLQAIKQRFGIIGNSPKINYALETAIKVAPTDISVYIQGESGVGKESSASRVASMVLLASTTAHCAEMLRTFGCPLTRTSIVRTAPPLTFNLVT